MGSNGSESVLDEIGEGFCVSSDIMREGNNYKSHNNIIRGFE